jgi:nicotinate-nucleotide adenylyltransferase
MIKRIGVLGGTFNPIHLGHLHIAGEIQKAFSLSRVYFVVATAPPHKAPEDLIPFMHRYAMVSLATLGTPSFLPSMVELEPRASAFSIDTMLKLARSLGREADLYFIAGGDSLAEVNSWQDSEKLLTSHSFVFAMRPGIGPVVPRDVLPLKAAALARDLTGLGPAAIRRAIREQTDAKRIYIMDVGAPNISATRIRRLVSSGTSIRRMVPGPVSEYIHKLHLYGGR